MIKKSSSVILILIVGLHVLNGQSFVKDITISAGEGYSPEFDGAFSLGDGSPYPVANSFLQTGNADEYPYPCYKSVSYSNNKGGFVDVRFKWNLSVGIAASYQEATMEWTPGAPGPDSPDGYVFSDNVSRTNVALRVLYHPPLRSKHFDIYYGIRYGKSYWHDTPSDTNTVVYTTGNGKVSNTSYFLQNQNMVVPSFQMLMGMRFYFADFFALHLEAGIGSPYLIEGGITFRLNFAKDDFSYDSLF